jgi:hypothetical protein
LESFARNVETWSKIAQGVAEIYQTYLNVEEKRGKNAHTKALDKLELESKDLDLKSKVSKNECEQRNSDVDFFTNKEKLSPSSQRHLEERYWPPTAPQHQSIKPQRYQEPQVGTQTMWRPSQREDDRYRAGQYEVCPAEVRRVRNPIQYEQVRTRKHYSPELPTKHETTESYRYSRKTYPSSRHWWQKNKGRVESKERWSRSSRKLPAYDGESSRRGSLDEDEYESWSERRYRK